ncbi:MAG: adenylyl-sulfate kinase [Candidatus Omnitrophica bacterium]|nr:adenylyl-sulfate kinase [Candidatus Omnitrophota bacterium]
MKKTLIFWFTGLSGSGKSTIVRRAAALLSRRGKKIKVYDGDTVRKKVNRHLSFSPRDIHENNKIIARLCLSDIKNNKYDYVFVAVISPFLRSRKQVKKIVGSSLYLIYCKSSINKVISRDPKGLYKKALSGRIKNFIGIDEKVPYQAPVRANLVLDTGNKSVSVCVKRFISFINSKENG